MLAFELIVSILGLLDLAVNSINLKLVGLYLRLVVLQLGNHLLELFASFLKVLLVDDQLLSDFWATLLSENVLQLNIELLLLLDEDIFFGHFLSFSDQSFLQRLDLLD